MNQADSWQAGKKVNNLYFTSDKLINSIKINYYFTFNQYYIIYSMNTYTAVDILTFIDCPPN